MGIVKIEPFFLYDPSLRYGMFEKQNSGFLLFYFFFNLDSSKGENLNLCFH